ncbi:hypothetical protein P170DRAFT_397010 [Aspergillus steynii IBT 23096]|uniref:Zn(2)-C6 fungal-type domain-containing protein n=1 Tax=Aspergillus steynii IBT 23096 TaxID=1392250 RepID=A0A2I2GMB6_9EURO|nr:uncharacterized protein P170DRAFT_397010 [Aspergillus steynii IBT 23096]PLB54014.1 hypothetical protein P170DRAFT_397010 [Aspergillus steynii IBT 23096]
MLAIKRPRRSTPKVRSGCSTCKARRIKCDEATPECLRCVRSGRSCGGYTVQATARTSPAGTIKAYSIPFKVPGSQVDRQLLHFYCSEAASRLAGFSDPTLWTQLILQRCHHQPVIRSALVALSSLYRDHMCSASNSAPVSFQSRPSSMEIISKCHRQLASHLRSPGASTEVALICGLIFYTFECLVGDARQATWHLDQSLRLLQRTFIENPNFFASSDGISDHLISIFTRLDVQASIFDSDRLPGLRLLPQGSVASSLDSIVPDSFVDLSHAEDVLTRLQNITMHHITFYLEYKRYSWDQLPIYVRTERLAIVAWFEKFELATTELLGRIDQHQHQHHGSPNPDNSKTQTSHQHILLLQIQAEMFHSILVEDNSLSPTTRETGSAAENRLDAAATHISTLLDLAKKETSSPLSGSGFMLSTQLIATLYYICMKAQKRQTRQLALSLLQDSAVPEREGLWDAKSAVFVVQSMMSDYECEDASEDWAEARLEDFGEGVVDAGGLDSAFQLLTISREAEGVVGV